MITLNKNFIYLMLICIVIQTIYCILNLIYAGNIINSVRYEILNGWFFFLFLSLLSASSVYFKRVSVFMLILTFWWILNLHSSRTENPNITDMSNLYLSHGMIANLMLNYFSVFDLKFRIFTLILITFSNSIYFLLVMFFYSRIPYWINSNTR